MSQSSLEPEQSVRAIVENWRMGLNPEEIREAFPHITLSQVFDALSYYLDNKEEINSYIENNKIPKEKMHPLLKNYE